MKWTPQKASFITPFRVYNTDSPRQVLEKQDALYFAGSSDVVLYTLTLMSNKPSLPPRKLLDQVRDRLRAEHYGLHTEHTTVLRIRRSILFHGKRHPREMSGAVGGIPFPSGRGAPLGGFDSARIGCADTGGAAIESHLGCASFLGAPNEP